MIEPPIVFIPYCNLGRCGWFGPSTDAPLADQAAAAHLADVHPGLRLWSPQRQVAAVALLMVVPGAASSRGRGLP